MGRARMYRMCYQSFPRKGNKYTAATGGCKKVCRGLSKLCFVSPYNMYRHMCKTSAPHMYNHFDGPFCLYVSRRLHTVLGRMHLHRPGRSQASTGSSLLSKIDMAPGARMLDDAMSVYNSKEWILKDLASPVYEHKTQLDSSIS